MLSLRLRCWPVQNLSRTSGGIDLASLPQLFRDRKRGDLHVRPPVCFVAVAVKVVVVRAAERDCKLVTDFASQ